LFLQQLKWYSFEVIENFMVRWKEYEFLFTSSSNYGFMLHRFQDTTSLLAENQELFNTTPAFNAHVIK